MTIAIFGNTYKEENLCLLRTLLDILNKKKVKVRIEERFYRYMLEHIDFEPDITGLINNTGFEADLAISIGGDGTFLRTASFVGKKSIPIVGINTGRLGFLADIASTDIEIPLENILNKDFLVEERSVLQLNCEHCPPFAQHNHALNEIAVLKQDSSSMIAIHTYINGQHLTSYQADGLIVATPTGSTAYSLSVGGPILVPQSKSIILTPVAPHSLTVRPLVITDDSEISLHIDSRTKSFLASVDGRSEVLGQEIEIRIKKADFTVKVLKQKDHNFFNTLRTKLMWGRDTRLDADEMARW
jgi:NAD+ kinase